MEKIRAANFSDAGRIKEIASRAGYVDYISRNVNTMLANGGMYLYEDKNVEGFLQARFRNICWISAIRVDPDYRRQGIAEKMIRHVEELGKAKGCKSYGALVTDDNTPSREMFRKLGYVEKEYYGTFLCEPSDLTEVKNWKIANEYLFLDWEIWEKNEAMKEIPGLKKFKDSNGNEYITSTEGFELIKLIKAPDYSEGENYITINKKILSENMIKEMKDVSTETFIFYQKII